MKSDKNIHIRITEELLNKIKEKAEKENRTVSNYILNLVKNDLKDGQK